MSQPSPEPPAFDSGASHHQRPRLRPVRGFPAQHGDQTVLALADARQISDQVVFTVPAAQMILPHMDGQKDLDSIVSAVGHGLTREMLQQLVAQLDSAGLLEGPTFDAMLSKLRTQFDASPELPPSSTADFADALVVQEIGESATDDQKKELGPQKLRQAMDKWIDETLGPVQDPSFNALPRAIVVPHLDYWRGWRNYAHAYGRMRVVDRPDRVVILGTNHFGRATGVCACDKGYQTPLGVCRLDEQLVAALKKHLGPEATGRAFEHRFDHEREHSIELQIPWIQHVFGPGDGAEYPRVFGVLVHDPVPNSGESYDGSGVSLSQFVEAMKKAIAEMPGRTLVVASADLSHVGASFGDKLNVVADEPESKAFRDKVVGHDREMLALIEGCKAEELVASMAWQQNPTRWCSVGNLVATMKLTDASRVRVLPYMAAADQQGIAMVTSIAGAIE